MYNIKPILISYIILIILFYIFILIGLKEKKIGMSILKLLPIAVIIDIPINYIFGVDKTSISLRLWNFISILIVFIFYKETIVNLKKGKKYLAFLYVFFVIHLILNGFNLVVIRGYIKFVFSYIPLIISIKIFIDKFNINTQIKILKFSAIIIIVFSLFQLIMFKVLNKNYFIIPLFQKISATFSEPIWSGVYLSFLFIVLTKSKYKVTRFLCILCMILSASEASLLGLIIVYIITSKNKYTRLISISISITIIYIFLKNNIISTDNILESFYIHSSNWIVSLIAYSKGNLLHMIFGLGLSNANAIASTLDLGLIANFLGINKSFIGLTTNQLGGDTSNIIVEVLTSFGIIGLIIFIMFNVKNIKKMLKENNIIYLRVYLFYLTVSLIHPLYYMGFGIFILMYSLCNSSEENVINE